MPLPNVPEEREQGAVLADEQLAAMAPVSQMGDVSPIGETTQIGNPNTQTGNVAPQAGVVQAAQQAPTPNMWRIPTDYSKVLGNQPKSLAQRQEDVGQLWMALASDPKVHPIVRQIAESLLGGRR